MRASSSAGGRIFTRAAASSMASGSPSRRRQISTTASAFLRRQREIGPAGRGALHEQRDRRALHQSGRRGGGIGIRERQGRDRELLFAVDVQDQAAGDEDLERRTGVEQLPHQRRRVGHLLEVVHDQQRRSQAAKLLGDRAHQWTVAALTHAEREGHGRCHQPGIGDRRQVDERDAALEVQRPDRRRPGRPGASSRFHPVRSASAAERPGSSSRLLTAASSVVRPIRGVRCGGRLCTRAARSRGRSTSRDRRRREAR